MLIMKKFNRYTFFALLGVMFILLVYKAIHLPVTNDEVPAAVHYMNFSVWEIMMFPDHEPNNHILNTLLVKLFVFIFGNHQIVIRLPNLLSFLVYGIAIFRINKLVLKEDSVFFLPAALFFISNPYLLDFFGLCRGYGISCALATLSVSYLIYGYYYNKDKPVWIAFGLSILASYANFTLLVFWIAASIMAWFYFAVKSGRRFRQIIWPTLIMVIVSLLYFALIATPLKKMHSTNEFQYWSSKGFYRDTIYPFIEYSRDGSHMILDGRSDLVAVLIFLTLAANLVFIFIRFRKSDYKISSLNHPVFVTTFILLVAVFVNIAQCKILHTPNLHGRTALFFYPLFIASFAGFLGMIPASRAKWAQYFFACCFAFICIFHVADRYKLDWVRDWWHDVDTLKVIAYLEEQHPGDKVSLKTTWFCFNSFYYYVYTGKTPWLDIKGYDKSIDINTDAEYYYLFTADRKILEPKFEFIREYGDRSLLKRRPGY